MEGATPEKIGAFKQLCLQAALQVADGQPGYGILCDSRLGRDALYRGRRHRPLDRPAGRMARLAPADAGARARPRLRRPVRNGRWSMWSRSSASTTPTTTPRLKAEQEDDRPAPVPRLPPQPAGVAAGDHPVQGRARTDDQTTRRRSSSASTTLASTPTGGSWNRSPPTPPGTNACAAITAQRPAHARHRRAWASMPPRPTLRPRLRLRPGTIWSKASPSAARSLAMPRAAGWRATMTDAAAVAMMADRYARLCRHLGRGAGQQGR